MTGSTWTKWLIEQLIDGPKEKASVIDAAKALGIGEAELRPFIEGVAVEVECLRLKTPADKE